VHTLTPAIGGYIHQRQQGGSCRCSSLSRGGMQHVHARVTLEYLSSSSSFRRADALRWKELCGAASDVRWRSKDDMLPREPRCLSARPGNRICSLSASVSLASGATDRFD
jgi:hypothetical protein